MPDEIVLEAPHDMPSGMPTGTLPQSPEPPPGPPQPPPAAEPEPPPPGDEEIDLDTGEPVGGRRTLVGDLVREREQRRIAETQASSAQDLLRQVMQTPDGLALLQRVASGAPSGPDPAEQQALQQELEATAIDLGLYDTEGNPDLQAAGRIMAREQRRVEAQVARAVQHLQATELAPIKQQRAEGIIAHVKNVAAHYGIDPDMVERGMRTLPVEQMGNPEVQQTVLMTALGLQTFGAGGAPQPPQAPQRGPAMGAQRGQLRPPIYSEPAGGRPRAQPQLDEPFRARLRESGLKDDDINASLSRFVPGAPNRLE
jgi:hypothetical protein